MKTNTPTFRAHTGKPAFRNFRAVVAGVILAAAAALLVPASAPVLAGSQGNPNPRVHPLNSKPYGNSYGEWAAIYWQWLLSFPADASPAYEQGEVVYGAQKQSGPVWILESGNAGVWERQARVPVGKGLLFSITGTECDTLGSPGASEQDLLHCVTAPFNELTVLATGEVDGVPIASVDQYLVTSPLFDISVPEPSLLGTPGGTGQAMAKGWFFILAPLSKGEHSLRVIYHVVELPEIDGDTTYHLTVE